MASYNALRVLRHLRKLSGSSESTLTYCPGSSCFGRLDRAEKPYYYSKYSREIGSILAVLLQEGYIEWEKHTGNFHLTDKAIHPYDLAFQQLVSFIINSVLVPIAVSCITTLITLALSA